MAAKKKGKTALAKEFSRIKRLLKKEEFRAQAVELLQALDEPHHWAAAVALIDVDVDRYGAARVSGADMRLLAMIPKETNGTDALKRKITTLKLHSNSAVWAEAVPYLEYMSYRGGRRAPWTSLSEVAKLPQLQELVVAHTDIVEGSLEGLQARKLSLTDCTLVSVPSLAKLEELVLQRVGPIAIGELPKLTTLQIMQSPLLVDWGGVGASRHLRDVVIDRDTDLRDLDVIGDAVAQGSPLKSVRVYTANLLESIDGLRDAKTLESLVIRHAAILDNIAALSNKPHLEHLVLRETSIADLRSLADALALRVLDLSGCTVAKGIEAIAELPELRVLALGGTPFTPKDLPPELLPHATWVMNPDIVALGARPRWAS